MGLTESAALEAVNVNVDDDYAPTLRLDQELKDRTKRTTAKWHRECRKKRS